MTITTRIAAAGLAIALLAGCSGGDDPAEPTAASASPSPSVAALDDRPVDEQLIEAIQAGDVDLARLALDAGADPNGEVGDDLSALHAAVVREDPDLVTALLDAGADPAAVGPYDRTPLHQAASMGASPDIVFALVDAGAPLDAFSSARINASPLHEAAYAGHVETTQALLEAGAPIDLPNPVYGASALFVAAFADRAEVVETLALAGADVNFVELDGDTPLDVALASNSQDSVSVLESFGAVSGADL